MNNNPTRLRHLGNAPSSPITLEEDLDNAVSRKKTEIVED